MKRTVLAGVLVALACGMGALALRPGSVQSTPRRATIADLAWMQGSWVGAAFGGVAEETWSKAGSGGMMGMFRLLDGEGKISLYEFLLIEEGPKGLQLRFKHFNPGYEPWEDEPLSFQLESWTERRVQFVSSDPGQSPSHLLYSRPDDGQMLVTVQTIREGRDSESFDVLFKRPE